MPLVATLLTLVISFVYLGRVGHAHEVGSAPEPVRATTDDRHDGGDLLSALTRWLADDRLGIEDRLKIAAVRQQWLAELMERNPAEVLRQAVAPAAHSALAPELQALVETEENHEGALEVLHADGPQGGTYHYALRNASGKRLDLRFAQGGPNLLTGTTVRVSGVRVQETLALGSSGSLTVLGLPPLPGTFGTRNVLVVLLRFLDTLPSASPPVSTVESLMFGTGATSVASFFRENSYQQMSLTGTVVGPLLIPTTSAGCDYYLIASLAQQAIATIGVVLGQYQHVVYSFPSSGCAWWGLGSIGGVPGQVWVNGGLQAFVASHELGHNLGLYHSHALECGSATMGGSCSSIDYGDVFDVMGSGSGPTHFNAVQKDLLGWLGYGASPPITDVVASGTYTIDPFEPTGTNPKALRVTTALGDWLYVEYRRPFGFDSYLSGNPNVMGGVLVHYFDGSPNGIYLLDMTPATSSWFDPALAIGATFQDVEGQVSITPISTTGTVVSVSVTVGPGCTRAAPTVTLTPAQQDGPAGSTRAYGVSVKNNGAGCGASVFDLQVSAPPGWTTTLGSGALTLAEGATGSTTLQVTSSAAAAAGTYALTLATSEAGLSSSAAAGYTVTAVGGGGGGGTPGGFVDSFDRVDAPDLGNGWSVVAGSLTIVANEARNGVANVLHTAVRPELAGAVQTVDVTFASVNNNVGPRFGIVLRYGGPGTYYLCYRRVGGTSALRIAKVVNGVETILKSVTVGNPATKSLFTLSCAANGAALTLKVGGVVKATATDTALTTGSVGFAIGGGASHRATSFSATVQ